MSKSATVEQRRECDCPACLADNGGLDYCARCRYNDCTPEHACCGQGDDA